MRVIVITLAVVIVAVALMTLVGVWLPKGHVASLERHLPIDPQGLWAILTDVEAFPLWRQDVTQVDTRLDNSGLSGWTEHSSNGTIRFAVDRMEPPRVLVVRIADRDLPFGGTWAYEISPDGPASSLRITERGEVYNPLFRFVARFGYGHDRTIRTFLDALERRVAQQEQRGGI
jgi:uncharacterized protein YndB with AHSA1/START domain